MLAADKAPDFIDLNPLGGNVANHPVLVFGTGRSNAHQQAKDGAFRDASQANGGTNRAAFDQRFDHCYFLRCADYVCHNQSIRQRFRIVKRKGQNGQFLSGFLRFGPSRFSGFSCTSSPLLVCHGLKTALAADPATLGSHFPHDLLNDVKLDSFSGLNGFQENAPGVLHSIKFFGCAFPLWHTSSVARQAGVRQEAGISNGPTTENKVQHGFGASSDIDFPPEPRDIPQVRRNKHLTPNPPLPHAPRPFSPPKPVHHFLKIYFLCFQLPFSRITPQPNRHMPT